MPDTPDYVEKKKFFSTVLTIYGRKPVLECLTLPDAQALSLHLADSNKKAGILDEIIGLAEKQKIDIRYHSREALSRISKNKKQDQGIALDIHPKGFQTLEDFIDGQPKNFELIALDNITNPQNLGMIIRSICASPMTGILLPDKGCAKLDALVIKASAGTLFKAKIIRCEQLPESLKRLQRLGASTISLDLKATSSLSDLDKKQNKVFVLGNETDGVSKEVSKACDSFIKIPMSNDVESLNVAVTAGIIAFRNL
ncbi:MAG: 23S rRNA (guanosine(2251)-2'-O)-methyltransferase RlmB [Agarilytica sp.]